MIARPTLEITDPAAWSDFEARVRAGAGVRDDLAQPEALRASQRDIRFLLGLVDHHRENSIPFLSSECGLEGVEVFEMGAGTAALAVAMAEQGARVVAVEPERHNYEAGLARIRAYGAQDRIRLEHVTDTSRLPHDSGSFDVCVCSSVLQYVPLSVQRRALLAEIFRVLRPGGLLAILGSGNGLFPGGPHSARWWSNLLPSTAARLGHTRGVTAWEILSLAPGRSARLLRERSWPVAALDRWRRRLNDARRPRERAIHFAALAFYALLDKLLCGPLGLPVGAFTPFLSVVFQKLPSATADSCCHASFRGRSSPIAGGAGESPIRWERSTGHDLSGGGDLC